MKLSRSPFILKDFVVLDMKYNFIEPDENHIGPENTFDLYDLEFDFMLRKRNDEHLLYTKISINKVDTPLPGYSIYLEGVTVFSFDESIEDEKARIEYIFNSGLGIALANIRSNVATFTAYGPFGKFVLPAIDMRALHEEKRKKIVGKNKNRNK